MMQKGKQRRLPRRMERVLRVYDAPTILARAWEGGKGMVHEYYPKCLMRHAHTKDNCNGQLQNKLWCVVTQSACPFNNEQGQGP